VTHRLDDLEFHQPPRQQPKAPAGVTRRRLGTREFEQRRLGFAVELRRVLPGRAGQAVDRDLRAVLHRSLAQAFDRTGREPHRLADPWVGRRRSVIAGIGQQQRPGAGELAGIAATATGQRFKFSPLLGRQNDRVLLPHQALRGQKEKASLRWAPEEVRLTDY